MEFVRTSPMHFEELTFLDLDTVDQGDIDLDPIRSQAERFTPWPSTASTEIEAHAGRADAIVLNKVRLDADAFARLAPKIVCLAATGSDNVDLDAARKTGVAVANIRDYFTDSVAQLTFALDRKSTRLNSSHVAISYAVFCLKKKKQKV